MAEEEQKANEEVQKQTASKEVDELPGRADYMVHVLIQKAKEIKVESGSTIDPMFKVGAFDQSIFSEAKDDITGIGETVWDEHLFIEARDVTKRNAESTKIKIELMDKGFFKNTKIGHFEFDVAQIHKMEDHALQHQWLCLNNPEADDYDVIKGYVKVSISVTYGKDKAPELTQDVNNVGDDKKPMEAPSLNPTFYQCKIKIFTAQKLAKMDPPSDLVGLIDKGGIDAYLKLEHNGKKFRTQVKTSKVLNQGEDFCDDCIFNEEFWITCRMPVLEPFIYIRVMDSDPISPDEMVGTIAIATKDIINAGDGQYKWYQVFGAPLNQNGSDQRTLMNKNPDFASTFKGRILMKLESKKEDKPIQQQRHMDQALEVKIPEVAEHMRLKTYHVACEIGQAVALKECQDVEKYSIRATIGGEYLHFDPMEQNLGNCARYPRQVQTFQLPFSCIEEMDNICFQLMDPNHQPIAYKFIPAKDFTTHAVESHWENEKDKFKGPRIKWYQFLPDGAVQAFGKADGHRAGMFSLRMQIMDEEKDRKQPWLQNDLDTLMKKWEDKDKARGKPQPTYQIAYYKKYARWAKKQQTRLNARKIRAYIIQCRNLPAADAEGSCDPFIHMWDMDSNGDMLKDFRESQGENPSRRTCTSVIEDTLNPIYQQVLDLNYEVEDVDDKETWPPFIMDIYDRDMDFMTESVDYIGRCIVEPEDYIDVQMPDGEGAYDTVRHPTVLDQEYFEQQRADGRELNFEENDEFAFLKEYPPTWFPVRFAPGEPQAGEVLVKFYSCELDTRLEPAGHFDMSKLIKYADHDISILVLGLRNLKSAGILPVKKAYIDFQAKQMLPPNKGNLRNVSTLPTDPGPNPTLNTTITIQAPMPIDPLYAPSMQCQVHDNIFAGWIQPVIGTFQIHFGEIQREQERKFTENMEALKFNIETLDDYLTGKEDLPIGDYAQHQPEMDFAPLEANVPKQALAGGSLKKKVFESDVQDAESKESLGASELAGNATAEVNAQSRIDFLKKKRLDLIGKGDGYDAEEEHKLMKQATKIEVTGAKNIFKMDDVKNKLKKGKGEGQKMSKKELRNEIKKIDEELSKIKENDKIREEEEFARNSGSDFRIVLMPQYETDTKLKIDREIKIPPPALYKDLGWDENKETKRKHYRYIVHQELELDTDYMEEPSPFKKFDLHRGQSRGLENDNGLFSFFGTSDVDASGAVTDDQTVGYFKGLVTLDNTESTKDDFDQLRVLAADMMQKVKDLHKKLCDEKKLTGDNAKPLDFSMEKLTDAQEKNKLKRMFRAMGIDTLFILQVLAAVSEGDRIQRQLMNPKDCTVRLYVVEGYNMARRDNDSNSDPYLVISCNQDYISERDEYQIDTTDPQFHRYYDFKCKFPGTSPINIEVWDYDGLFGDEIIGTTSIDIEDRFFSGDWQSLNNKPVEIRNLYTKQSDNSQGEIMCWVEIWPESVDIRRVKTFDIKPKPPVPLEVRICVLNCKDVQKPAENWDLMDPYVRVFFDSNEAQCTDTHFRCQDDKPDYEYRLLFDSDYPRKKSDYKMTFVMQDQDFFSANDVIGQAQIDLKQIMEDASRVGKTLILNKKYHEECLTQTGQHETLEFDSEDPNTIWLPMVMPGQGSVGKIRIRVDVITQTEAVKNKVGKAREEPNHSPHLPQPEGRFEFSLNPFKLLGQLLSPEIKAKLLRWLCYIVLIALCIALLPNILGGVITKGILSIFGLG